VLGDRNACVAREITKAFESISHGTLSELLQGIEDNTDSQKGEFVVVISGAPPDESTFDSSTQDLLAELAAVMAPRQAAKIVARHSGLASKELYDWLLQQK